MKLNKDTPRLEEAVVFHNGVTQWTICSIMKEITAAKRAAVIVKFIDVALVCVYYACRVCVVHTCIICIECVVCMHPCVCCMFILAL